MQPQVNNYRPQYQQQYQQQQQQQQYLPNRGASNQSNQYRLVNTHSNQTAGAAQKNVGDEQKLTNDEFM